MRDSFLEKPFTKCGAETSPSTFSRKLKLSTSQDQQPEHLHSLFLYYVQVEDYQDIKT